MLPGLRLLDVGSCEDIRGLFCEVVSPRLVEQVPELGALVQVNAVTNPQAYTLRGLHWQADPYAQGKWIRVLTGSLVDLVFDLRRDSPTFGQGCRIELTSASQGLWVPRGFAHGYLTTSAHTTVLYAVDAVWTPSCECVGSARVLVSDAEWARAMMNDKDRNAPSWNGLAFGAA